MRQAPGRGSLLVSALPRYTAAIRPLAAAGFAPPEIEVDSFDLGASRDFLLQPLSSFSPSGAEHEYITCG